MIRVIETALFGSATVVIAGVVLAAAQVAYSWSIGDRRDGIAPVRAIALLGVAMYVWLHFGVKPPGAPGLAYWFFCLALVTGLALGVRPARFRDWTARAGGWLIAIPLACLLPVIVLPLARHWDTSGWMDSQSYDTFAINIVTGKQLSGSSGYMPVYQYGMAAIYYVFGHFFFAQQIANAVLAVVGVVSLCGAAWVLFNRSRAAVLVTGLVAVYCTQFFLSLHITQIESWYVPIICVLLLAWAHYWRSPSIAGASLLAAAIGLGMNTRNQGALFFAFMSLAPFAVRGLDLRRRLTHLLAIAAVVAVMLTPWTLRNYSVDGRLSPMADRSAMYIGLLTDHRMGLYGIRYWEGWDQVAVDYQARYPDLAARERAYLEGAWRNVTSDRVWLSKAVAWRAAAYYGVLPDGYLNASGIVSPKWREEWRGYVASRTTQLLLLPLSLLGVMVRPGRTSLFLLGAILASLAIVVVSASPEDRISYPALPLHILLCAGIFAAREGDRDAAVRETPMRHSASWRPWVVAAVVVLVCLVGSRAAFGSRFTYRPLMETATRPNPALTIDASLPRINDLYAAQEQGQSEPLMPAFAVGNRVRMRAMVSNYQYPPKFVGPVAWVPAFATDPATEDYYFAYLIDDGDRPLLGPAVGVTFAGAEISEPLSEGQAVELEGEVRHAEPRTSTGFWVRALKVKVLPIPAAAMPVFP